MTRLDSHKVRNTAWMREEAIANVPEMSLLGGAALHGFVMGVQVRVVVNL